jgi:hypothetical protein
MQKLQFLTLNMDMHAGYNELMQSSTAIITQTMGEMC